MVPLFSPDLNSINHKAAILIHSIRQTLIEQLLCTRLGEGMKNNTEYLLSVHTWQSAFICFEAGEALSQDSGDLISRVTSAICLLKFDLRLSLSAPCVNMRLRIHTFSVLNGYGAILVWDFVLFHGFSDFSKFLKMNCIWILNIFILDLSWKRPWRLFGAVTFPAASWGDA